MLYLERALDARTALSRHVAGLRGELGDQLGGAVNITPTQALVIEALVRQWVLSNAIDSEILSTPIDALNADHRKLLELGTKSRHAIATLAGMLGLERTPPPAKDASSILLEYAKESAKAPQERAVDVPEGSHQRAPGESAVEGEQTQNEGAP